MLTTTSPIFHDHDTIADAADEVHFVGDDDHRHAFAGKPFYELQRLADQLTVTFLLNNYDIVVSHVVTLSFFHTSSKSLDS